MKYALIAMAIFSPSLFAVEKEKVETSVSSEEAYQNEVDAKLLEMQYMQAFPSKYNRRGKKMTLALSTGFNYSNSSAGASLGFFLDDDSIIGASFYDLDDDNNFNEDYEEGLAIELSFKQFSGNSFYIQPFAYYRDVKEFEKESFFGSIENRSYTIRDVGVGIKIGNQWQWKNLTLGCDWFGINRQVSRLEEEGDEGFLSFNDDRTQFTLLNLYFGASF